MAHVLVIKARLGRRDKDIRRAIERIDLDEVILSDFVREGLRKVLVERGYMDTPVTISTAQQVARELMKNLQTAK